ncbi:hypothetical protein J437_LFUL006475 [Ladona fulva]|uniref:Uncharacterized protein n=1 Tax=Ladona fulva TaxID=123851 RepID=A0A8K0K3X7_LADFU|nr:hypothetical protein J437_LFUL006475 [Ladona fulva]
MATLAMPVIHKSLEAAEDDEELLSTGSVLVIIFFVFAFLYFFGGALANKLLRGAEGREMIPNYQFWVDLPYLCRDGASFLLNGCQVPATYESI